MSSIRAESANGYYSYPEILQRLQQDLERKGIRLVLVRAKRELIDDLEPTGLIDTIGADHIYPTLPTLISAFENRDGDETHTNTANTQDSRTGDEDEDEDERP